MMVEVDSSYDVAVLEMGMSDLFEIPTTAETEPLDLEVVRKIWVADEGGMGEDGGGMWEAPAQSPPQGGADGGNCQQT